MCWAALLSESTSKIYIWTDKMNTPITLKSESFKYPTKEEREKIGKLTPKINRLKVDYKSATIEILQNENFENAIRNEDIYWWNHCLNNRLGKLTETYVYVQTHFLRLQESLLKESNNRETDKILLDYYIEIFYYYFFSARDVLGQFLNVASDLKIREDKIFLDDKFVEKIKSGKIKVSLSTFLISTKDSYKIRNTFNHRFTPTHLDNRAKSNIIKEDNKISFNQAEDVKVETFIEDINNLMKYFERLMNEIKEEII